MFGFRQFYGNVFNVQLVNSTFAFKVFENIFYDFVNLDWNKIFRTKIISEKNRIQNLWN